MATNYPGSLDDFATTSPAKLSDDDSTGRTHAERHNDVESAVEAVQAVLGTDPAGAQATVKARLDLAARRLYVRQLTSGLWTSNQMGAGVSTATVSMTLNYVYYIPFWFAETVTIDRVAINVSTSGSGSCRIGTYAAGSDGLPTGAAVNDFGTVDVSTTGVKTLTISASMTGDSVTWFALHPSVTFSAQDAGVSLSVVCSQTQTNSTYGALRESQTYGSGLPTVGSPTAVIAAPSCIHVRRA